VVTNQATSLLFVEHWQASFLVGLPGLQHLITAFGERATEPAGPFGGLAQLDFLFQI
jgi:hypothetical protein